MPPPQLHFAVGALAGLVILLCTIPIKPKWKVYLPLIIPLFGILSMVPDIPKEVKDFPSIPGSSLIGSDYVINTFDTKLANVFFMHPYLDSIISEQYQDLDPYAFTGFLIILAVYVTSFFYYIILIKTRKPKKKKK